MIFASLSIQKTQTQGFLDLGDFALGKDNEIRAIKEKLNGTIILLVGNHDYKTARKVGFLIVKGSLEIGNFLFSHLPLSQKEIPKEFINVHGHIHNKESLYGVNVSVEKTNYEPVDVREIRDFSEHPKVPSKNSRTF